MAKTYVVTSGKGGVGKTTTAVNLGAAINKFKEDVVIIDANMSTPNIGLYFGAPILPISLNNVLQGNAEIDEAIYEHESGTKIIPSSLSIKDLKNVNTKLMKDAIKKLGKLTNHIILDCAAGLGDEAKMAMEHADEVIIVTNPNILSVTDSLKAIKIAEELGKEVTGVIVTRVKNSKTEMPLANIKEMLEIPVLGIVPEDISIDRALVKKDAVVHTKPNSKSARAYQDIAAKLLGKRKRPESLLSSILKSIGLS